MTKSIWIIHHEGSTPDTGIGGRHYYLGEELAKLGYDVYLVMGSYCHTMRKPPNVNSIITFERRSENFNIIWVKLPNYAEAHSKKRVLNWFLFSSRIRRLYKKIESVPDIILSTSPPLIQFLGANWLTRKTGAKLVFEVRDIWPLTLTEMGNYSVNHPFIKLMQWIEDKAYKNSDLVISNLKYAVQHMEHRGMDVAKFHWIPNGFSLTEVNNKIELSDSIKEKIPKDKFIVGYTGSLGFANSLEHFIKAAVLLKNNNNIAFVLVGNGKLKSHLQNQVSVSNLSNVHFINAIPKIQVQSMLNLFDICYIGLKSEKIFTYGVSPNKLFDYLVSGKPIIYAIDSGNYHPVADAGAGIEITPECPEAIVDAILKIKNTSPESRKQMGERGKSLALANYEYSILAKKLEKAIFNQYFSGN